jgi:Outer membrane lipoprotein-sorting protein
MHCRRLRTGITAILSSLSIAVFAGGIPKDLPYPSAPPSALDVANQIYFVNHFYALRNYGITEKGRTITVLINLAKDSSPTTVTIERYLNNDYPADSEIKAMDLAIFRSGKLRGTGMLITDFNDDNKSQSYSIWLPALRKIRRFAEPAHDDAWGGTDFTFGDVTLRKPKDETHELLGKQTFDDCLGAIPSIEVRYLPHPPKASCDHKGREVYLLKSTAKRKNWWYDYRISYVDTKTFADYRTEYFKGGSKVKIIDRDWESLGLADPRAQSWRYWYGKTFATGHETWAVIPKEVVEFNQNWPASKWSESTLRRIRQ